MKFASATHVGRVRKVNEDFLITKEPVFIVADGMGGHSAGDIASKTAAQTALKIALNSKAQEIPSVLREAVEAANKKVVEKSKHINAHNDMGTTLTMVLIDGTTAHFAHVGDSRAYLLRQNEIEQLTEDHSLVGEMVKQGKISKSQADEHPYRNVITRAIGSDIEVKVDIFSRELKPGDRLLLASDGLTGMVKDPQIKQIIGNSDLNKACTDLIKAANDKGGQDNTSVVLIETGSKSPKSSGKQNSVSTFNKKIALSIFALLFTISPLIAGVLIKNNSYYLSTDKGKVTLHQGFPYAPLGLKLHKIKYISKVDVDGLDDSMKRGLRRTIIVKNEKEGLEAIEDIKEEASQ